MAPRWDHIPTVIQSGRPHVCFLQAPSFIWQNAIPIPEMWLIWILVTTLDFKSIFWYSARLLCAEYVIRKTSHRCPKHLEAGLRGACSIIHSLLFYSYLAWAFLSSLCKFSMALFKQFVKLTFIHPQFWSARYHREIMRIVTSRLRVIMNYSNMLKGSR